MSVLPVLGPPLHWPPALLALTAVSIAPGVHLLLSPLLEARQVTWRDDYAAVLVGDPLLAVAIGVAASLSRPTGPHGFPASWAAGGAQVSALSIDHTALVSPLRPPSPPPARRSAGLAEKRAGGRA